MLEFQPRDAELIDTVLLGRCQMAPDPHKALTGGELGGDLSGGKSRQDADKLAGGFGWVKDLLWIGIKRWAVEACGENVTVAVDDIGMAGQRRCDHPKARDLRFGGAASDSHDFDDPQCHYREDESKQPPGHKEPSAAGFESLLCGPIGNDEIGRASC